MSNPDYVVPEVGINPFRRTAVTPVRTVRAVSSNLTAGELPPGDAIISGTITFNGSPGTGAICSLVTDPANTLVRQTTADFGGNYSFTGIPPGRYQVLAYDPNLQYRSKVAHTVVS